MRPSASVSRMYLRPVRFRPQLVREVRTGFVRRGNTLSEPFEVVHLLEVLLQFFRHFVPQIGGLQQLSDDRADRVRQMGTFALAAR